MSTYINTDFRKTPAEVYPEVNESPVVSSIMLEGFRKNRLKPVVIVAKDIVKVEKVEIRIYDGYGCLLESGPAIQYLQHEKWFYFPGAGIDGWQVMIEAVAFDREGNQGFLIREPHRCQVLELA
jgi:hypothetical protein